MIAMKTELDRTPFPDPVPPYPGWECRIYRLPRPVTGDDITAFIGDQDLYIRENGKSPVIIIHKYGLLELHLMTGERDAEIWFSPEQTGWVTEYLDALLKTRF